MGISGDFKLEREFKELYRINLDSPFEGPVSQKITQIKEMEKEKKNLGYSTPKSSLICEGPVASDILAKRFVNVETLSITRPYL